MLFVDIPNAGEYWAIIEDAEVHGAKPPGACENTREALVTIRTFADRGRWAEEALSLAEAWTRAPLGFKRGFRAVHVRAASVALVRRLELKVGGEVVGAAPLEERPGERFVYPALGPLEGDP